MTIGKINRAIAFGCAVVLALAIAAPASARKPLRPHHRGLRLDLARREGRGALASVLRA
jgi:hypothetical protein